MGRTPAFCEKNNGVRKGPWTTEEDQKLTDYIHKNGYGNWRTLSKNAGLQRCGKSCRLRWTNYLRPDIKRGEISFDEEETIIQLHSVLGNKWSIIAARLPGRTDNEIKNYWNTHIRKRLLRMGIDPVTHNPRLDLSSILSLSLYNPPQLNLPKIQPMIDPELLGFAASLLHFQRIQNPNLIHHDPLKEYYLGNTLQFQLNHYLVQDQTRIQEIPNYSPVNTPSCVVPFYSETSKLMEPNVHQFPSSTIYDFKPSQSIDILTCNSLENIVTLDDNYGYHMDPRLNFVNESSLTSSFLDSSAPSSSSTPMTLNSNSSYINGSNTTDREISNCSSLFKHEFQELLNSSVFM